MKTKKKIATVTLCALLAVCSVPFTASAANGNSSYPVFLNGESCTIVNLGVGSGIISGLDGKTKDLDEIPKNGDGSDDLSSAEVYGGGSTNYLPSSNVTMVGGNVAKITAAGENGKVNDATMIVNGGKIGYLSNQHKGFTDNSKILIVGGASQKVEIDNLVPGAELRGGASDINEIKIQAGNIKNIGEGFVASEGSINLVIIGGNFVNGPAKLKAKIPSGDGKTYREFEYSPVNTNGQKLVYKKYKINGVSSIEKNKDVSDIIVSDHSSYGSVGVNTGSNGELGVYIPGGTDITEIKIAGASYLLSADKKSLDINQIHDVNLNNRTPKVGDTLKVSYLSTNATVNITWSLDGVPIDGETTSSYTVKASDLGKHISVAVSGIGKYTGSAGAYVSAVTKAADPAKTPKITETTEAAKEGNPKTGTAGIGLFAIVSLISATGLKAVSKKKSK